MAGAMNAGGYRYGVPLLIAVAVFLGGTNVSPGQSLTDHVVLVIIDGARYSETLGDTLARYVPSMRQLADNGVIVDPMLNDGVTVTKRGIPAIWSGSWSVPVDTFLPGSISTQYATAPTMWEYLRKAKGYDSSQAVYVIKQLPSPWLQSYHPEYGPAYWPWYILYGSTDREVWDRAKGVLETHHPVLSVIYFADVDHEGHSGNWTSYTNAIMIADSIVAEVWNLLDTDSTFKGTSTMFVTNDHGRHLDSVQNGFAGHGDGCLGCRQVMLLGIGKGVRTGIRSSVTRSLVDIAPTIGAILQFPTPYVTGTVMTEVLSSVVSVPHASTQVPGTIILDQNFPNPFNPSTHVSWNLTGQAWVNVAVFDLLGREITVLADQEYAAGGHAVSWEARGQVSGIYILRAEVTGSDGIRYTDSKKMILMQ